MPCSDGHWHEIESRRHGVRIDPLEVSEIARVQNNDGQSKDTYDTLGGIRNGKGTKREESMGQ